MREQKIIYIFVSVFCVIAIISGIYAQFFIDDKRDINNDEIEESILEEKTQEEIQEELTLILKNKLCNTNYENKSIKKIKQDENIVYTYKTINRKTDKYEMNVNLPMINISEDVPEQFNEITKNVFESKVNQIINNENISNTILNIRYGANVSGDILSVIIEVTLKEGKNPQQVAIQTYNYNLDTKKEVEFLDILSAKGIVQSAAKTKILKIIKAEKKKADVLVASGYMMYNRKMDDKMYKLENINNYFIDENNNLYVIFAYGNQIRTSEKDIILFQNTDIENNNNNNEEIDTNERNHIKEKENRNV